MIYNYISNLRHPRRILYNYTLHSLIRTHLLDRLKFKKLETHCWIVTRSWVLLLSTGDVTLPLISMKTCHSHSFLTYKLWNHHLHTTYIPLINGHLALPFDMFHWSLGCEPNPVQPGPSLPWRLRGPPDTTRMRHPGILRVSRRGKALNTW